MSVVNWLTGIDLERYVARNGTIQTQISFLGVFAVDTLPPHIPFHEPNLLIVNSDTANLPGKHWRAIFISVGNQYGEVFDSLAAPVSCLLEKWMNGHTMRWTCSDTPIQHSLSPSCGAFALHFVMHRLVESNLHNYTLHYFTAEERRNETFILNFVRQLK